MRKYDVGFLGGGQLARMSIQAAQRMGLECLSLDPAEKTPASGVAAAQVGALDDPEAIAGVFEVCERVTLENEFIPAGSVSTALVIAGREADCLLPGVECLSVVQDKLRQRESYASAGVTCPRAVEIQGDDAEAIDKIGFPMVLKKRFGGYDGKGTRYARDKNEFETHRHLLSQDGWMAEEFVEFVREVAVMVCRSRAQTVCFPTMVTQQKDHVCDLVFPCESDASLTAIAAVEAVGGNGLFGVEIFERRDGSFSVNEIAPRPHNSGHYTLDWGGVSQFEAHVRLVMGQPVPELQGQDTCMANLLGQDSTGDFRAAIIKVVSSDPGVHVHWYGKSEARPGRKMGHINVVGMDCIARAKRAQALFYETWTIA